MVDTEGKGWWSVAATDRKKKKSDVYPLPVMWVAGPSVTYGWEGVRGEAVALRTFCVNGDCGQNLRRLGELVKRTSGKRQNQTGARLEGRTGPGRLVFLTTLKDLWWS